MGCPYCDCRMIERKRQTAIEPVECLFYRLAIDVEGPLNVVILKAAMRTHEDVWRLFGVILMVLERMLNFLTLDIKELWVKKYKNFTEYLCRLACVRISIS